MAYPETLKDFSSVDLSGLLGEHQSLLKDGTVVKLMRLNKRVDTSIVEAMHELFNYEVRDSGDSYPTEEPLSLEEFKQYFTAYETFVLIVDNSEVPSRLKLVDNFTPKVRVGSESTFNLSCEELVGCFYIKPNWPGRCSHVCNGGFLVAPAYRQLGAAFIMGEMYRHLAKALGYHSSMFNLVFETNLASNALWSQLGFTNSGRIPCAGRIRLHTENDYAAVEDQVKAFRKKMILRSKEKGQELSTSEELLISSPLLDFDGIAPEKRSSEAYVAALQWFLDLRKPLESIAPRWIATGNVCA